MEEMILWQAGLNVYIQEAETNECCGSDHSPFYSPYHGIAPLTLTLYLTVMQS